VDVHFVSESDRPSKAPYTVFYDGGSKTYQVDQTGVSAGRWRTLGVHRNPHGDVAAITDQAGGTRATYGYTAYGTDDQSLFTGIALGCGSSEGASRLCVTRGS
jgi:hypothetical protein